MGYGFSECPVGGSWQGEGQAAETVPQGSPFYFTAFDTAPGNAQTVSKIEIDFHRGVTPFWDSSQQPVPNPIVVSGNQIASQNGQSAGCNVVGMYSLIGPYTVAGNIGNGTSFRCTAKVTAKNNLVYSVDPEIIVDGGGVDPV